MTENIEFMLYNIDDMIKADTFGIYNHLGSSKKLSYLQIVIFQIHRSKS